MRAKIQLVVAIILSVLGLLLLLWLIPHIGAADERMSAVAGHNAVAGPTQSISLTTWVTDTGGPLAGVVVSYTVARVPTGAAGYGVTPLTVTTDASGRATTTLTLGDVQGQYGVEARSLATNSPITFTTGAFYEQGWADDSSNPVFGKGAGGPDAYYPDVIYDAAAFSGHGEAAYYKLWASDGAGHTLYVTSTDGIAWPTYLTTTGLLNSHHVRVLYDANGFGGAETYYKIWYWDTSQLYSITAIRAATSTNGIEWLGDRVISQSETAPLVTGGDGDWNRGSYGPVDVLYQPGAANTGANPFDYAYVMYYDGTTGGVEQVGLAYSVDGFSWTRYGDAPVLPYTMGSWDSTHVGHGTVIKTDELFLFWYSGGTGKINAGIGYAVSLDGIHWDKRPGGPLPGVGELGVPGTWNDARNYTPAVLYDADGFSGHGENSRWKMWRTGKTGSNYAIGYASWDAGPNVVSGYAFKSHHALLYPAAGLCLLGMAWGFVLSKRR